MNRIAGLAPVLFLFVAGTATAGPDVVGVLKFWDGPLTVVRDGAPLPEAQLDAGLALENGDQLRVGAKGFAEVTLDTKTGVKADLWVKELTVITLDLSSLVKQSQTGVLDLVAGSIGLRVQKLVGGNRLDVRTATATAGVRGTVFDVETELDGSVLLVTTEGRVEVVPDGGEARFSVPGTAVSGDEEGPGSWTETPFTDPVAFVAAWRDEKGRKAEAKAAEMASRWAARYLDVEAKYRQAEARLGIGQAILDRWASEEKGGRKAAEKLEARVQERLAGALATIRQLASDLEQVGQRLTLLEARLGTERFQALSPSGMDLNWRTFVADWRSRRGDLERSLAVSAFQVKLYALRTGSPVERLPRKPLDKAPRPLP